MNLDQKIEAVLFFRGEPIAISELSKMLEVSKEDIKTALKTLEEKLVNRGLQLVFKDNEIMLGTNKEFSELIERLQKEELSKELSKASLETLAIILYKGGSIRSEIDWIRGVNSSFILRNLMIRGLVERIPNPKDKRTFLYRPTFDLLSFLGVSRIEELPDWTEIKEKLEKAVENEGTLS